MNFQIIIDVAEFFFIQIEKIANFHCFLDSSYQGTTFTRRLFTALVVWALLLSIINIFWLRVLHLFKYYVYAQYYPKAQEFRKKFGHTWVVITGGSDGIGLGLSKEFARLNMRLVVIARNIDKLQTVKQELLRIGSPEVDVIQADLSSAEDEGMLKRVEAELKLDQRRIGVLINNAGTTTSLRKFYKHSFATMKRVVNVNSLAPVFMCHLIAEHMNKHNLGLIVNTSSYSVDYGVPFMGVYIPSKTFLNNFTQLLSKEYPKLAIIALQTGFTRTKLLSGDLEDDWLIKNFLVTTVEKYVRSSLNIFTYIATSEVGFLYTAGHIKHQVYVSVAFLLEAFWIKTIGTYWVVRIRQNTKYRYSIDANTKNK